MILTKKTDVSINNRNLTHYRNKNYKCNSGDVIEVSVDDIPKGSKTIITAICDFCESEREIYLYAYWLSYDSGGYNIYSCTKCSYKKSRKTCVKKYGVENPAQSEVIKEKIKKTNLSRYGC